MATYPVTHINSEMRGAPIITGNARGNLIAAIDAWRLGFGQVTTIGVTVSGGVATATLQPSQGFDLHTVIEVAGATTPAALNGKSRVIEVNGDKTVIKFPTDAPNGTATGTITIKVAGSGWDKPFSAANKGVYRSADVLGARHFYRIDESGGVTNMARARGFENMTTVDAGTGLYPTNTQANGGGYWPKSSQANASPIRYDIVGDSRFVYISMAPGMGDLVDYNSGILRGFGDPIALNPAGDPFAACISCNQTSGASDAQLGAFDNYAQLGTGVVFSARSRAATGTAKDMGTRPFVGAVGGFSGEDSTLGPFPDPVDGRLKFSQIFIHDDSVGNVYTPRAVLPGLLRVPQSGVLAAVQARDYVVGSGALEGRILMALRTSMYPQGYANAVSFVDLTGPWRPL